MRKHHQFCPTALQPLEERRVPSHFAHVPAGVIAANRAHVGVHVGRNAVIVNTPYFHGRFPGTGGFGGVFIHTPGFYGQFPGSGGGGVVVNVPGFYGQFPGYGSGVVVNVPGFYGRF